MKSRLPVVVIVVVLAWLRPSAAAAQGSARDDSSGAAIYASACAACHGSDGRGLPEERVGFDTPLPDFTDCGFASPETADDWTTIVHDGGPARAFDRRMPAFGEALSSEEIAPHGSAKGDADFDAAGDRVRFVVRTGTGAGPYAITVSLWYQPIGFRWAHNLSGYDAPEPRRFVKYYESMASGSGVIVANASMRVN